MGIVDEKGEVIASGVLVKLTRNSAQEDVVLPRPAINTFASCERNLLARECVGRQAQITTIVVILSLDPRARAHHYSPFSRTPGP